MAFTSLIFLFAFFPLCVAGYYFIYFFIERKRKAAKFYAENLFLIIASLGFYAWANIDSAVKLCFYVVLIWICGCCLERSGKNVENKVWKHKKQLIFVVIILFVTGILFFYKYFNFVIENCNRWMHMELSFSEAVVPLGISFVTFSAISYLADVYRGDAKAGSLLDAALYLTFFPKIVSGPIVLWKEFQYQIPKRKVEEEYFLYGLNRMMIGFAKKVILADSFGSMVADITWYEMGIDQPTAWICAFFYMMQIYYDFAGYSDIAVGLCALFGFQVKENFHFPYTSVSISEFWRRWHISLGSWFREYIYIPLGGNRKGKYRTLLNLFLVFLLTGIWHGAGWNYIYWGAINGICVVIERCIRDKQLYQRVPKGIKWIFTMLIVYFSWIPFRIQSTGEILVFFKKMFGILAVENISYTYQHFLTRKMIVLSIIAVLGATVLRLHIFQQWSSQLENSKTGVIFKELGLIMLMILSVICMVNSTYSPFIYFQY